MTHDELISELRSSKLRKIAKPIEESVLPSIRLRTRRVPPEELAPGVTRMGGVPDWPAGTVWPSVDGTPLAFIAQIALSDLHRVEESSTARGWLYFFYEADSQQAWGFDPKQKDHWRVMHFDCPTDELERAQPPLLPEDVRFHSCACEMEIEHTLPPEEFLPEILNRKVTKKESAAYDELIDRLDEEGSILHRMFGFSNDIQGDMRLECQLALNGLYCGDLSVYDDPRAIELEDRDDGWVLLLQVDSDEEGPGWMWGDCGRLYFWMTEADLEEEAYDRAWMVLQCY